MYKPNTKNEALTNGSTDIKTVNHDSQSRKYFLTINNPVDYGFTHKEITSILVDKFKGIKYFCMADEQGECFHTHIYVTFSSPVRFSTLKKYFYQAHIESCKGNSEQNRAYIIKEGKWLEDTKHGTKIDGSFEEWGEIPQERQGARNDLTTLYELIKEGKSNFEILEECPDFLLRISDIDRVRFTLKQEEGKNSFRNLDVTYIFGNTGIGKTRFCMEKRGYENTYRVTDYLHPFDGYQGQSTICFDEFSSSLRIQEMLNYLDGYPLELPCRYANKQANFTEVFIISNLSLKEQYRNIQIEQPEVWKAFIRRIYKVIHFMPNGAMKDYETAEYINGYFIEKEENVDIRDTPFGNIKGR